jgi:hypothetical protein
MKNSSKDKSHTPNSNSHNNSVVIDTNINYTKQDLLNQDNDSFINYMREKMKMYEENINSCYVNIKEIINLLEEEYPMIDITSK